MTMAGAVLTKSQRKLWKRLDGGERLDALTGDELADWLAACRRLAGLADSAPVAAKARRMWQRRLREAQQELDRR
jgi:hypothetical protein